MPAGERLPGAPTESPDRVVLHVDMDCFYAACERLREPALVGEPVVVGMGYDAGEPHGAVATASYEAREFGVESAMPISQALERLPRVEDATTDDDADEAPGPAAHYRPVDMDFYRSVSDDVRAILHDVADVVREVSIDEAYLDVTDRTAWAVAEGFGRHVKDRIAREVGVTASVGVAPSMSVAKVASDREKPDGLVVVRPGEVRAFLAPLPVEELHGVGPVTAGELREADIETVGDLAGADPEWVADRYGERGRDLRRRARGEDDRAVEPVGEPKSLSRESSLVDPTDDVEEKRAKVRELAAAVADRARRKGALYRTIGIKVIEPPYEVHTRARSLSGPVDEPGLVESVALDLLAEFEDDAVRKLGVRVANLSFADQAQASLGSWEGDAPSSGAADEGGGPTDDGGDPTDDGRHADDDRAERDGRGATDDPGATGDDGADAVGRTDAGGRSRADGPDGGTSDDGGTSGDAEATADAEATVDAADDSPGRAGHGWRPTRPVQTTLSDFL